MRSLTARVAKRYIDTYKQRKVASKIRAGGGREVEVEEVLGEQLLPA